VPIYGDKSAVIKFLQANEWVKREEPRFDGRWQSTKFNLFRRVSEVVLGGKVGNFFERIVKFWQLRRIQKKIPPAGVGRVYISDEELEFHPDLRRIEEVVGRKTFQILDRI
jgi:hypothetical protein